MTLRNHAIYVLACLAIVCSLLVAGCGGASKIDEPEATAAPQEAPAEAEAPAQQTEPEPGVSLADIEFHVTTSVLEYSTKTNDPVGLVSYPETEGLVLTTEDKLDLTRVGMQTVTYLATLGNEQAQFAVDYEVRDTRSPAISLAADEVTVTEGDSYDPQTNVERVADEVEGELAYVTSTPDKLEGDSRGLSYEAGWYRIDGKLDTSVASKYFLTVVACDNHGNMTSKEFSVLVDPVEPEPQGGAAVAPVGGESAGPGEQGEAVQETGEPAAEPERHEMDYILNTNTGKFHYPDCKSVRRMADKNKQEFHGTREEVIGMGYDPCGNCNP